LWCRLIFRHTKTQPINKIFNLQRPSWIRFTETIHEWGLPRPFMNKVHQDCSWMRFTKTVHESGSPTRFIHEVYKRPFMNPVHQDCSWMRFTKDPLFIKFTKTLHEVYKDSSFMRFIKTTIFNIYILWIQVQNNKN
jgi:hypothetical protein